jgi:hypothetical protein
VAAAYQTAGQRARTGLARSLLTLSALGERD